MWERHLWSGCLSHERLNQPLALQKEKPTVTVYTVGSQFPQLCGDGIVLDDPQILFLLETSKYYMLAYPEKTLLKLQSS